MPFDPSENWYLKKHDSGEVFGPVPLRKIKEWADSAQVSPQDLISSDQVVWTRPPMIPELEMDWLVEVTDELLYGPTTAATLLEFFRNGEISESTRLINAATSERIPLGKTSFFVPDQINPNLSSASGGKQLSIQPTKGGLKVSLQRRILELEQLLLLRQRELNQANEKIERLEARVVELEGRLREVVKLRRG